jgi:hypothetical protein
MTTGIPQNSGQNKCTKKRFCRIYTFEAQKAFLQMKKSPIYRGFTRFFAFSDIVLLYKIHSLFAFVCRLYKSFYFFELPAVSRNIFGIFIS